VPRPVRPSKNWRGDNYLGKDPASTTVRHRPVDPAAHADSRRRFDRFLRKVDNGCQPVETLLDSLRNRAGGNPNSRLKARLNAGSDS